MDKEAKNIFEMTNEEAAVIIGNIPVYPDDCYSVSEYQWAKGMAIKALEQQPFINKPCVSEGVCREEIDKAQAVEQAYVDKVVELAVEKRKRPNGRWMKCKSRFGVEYFKCSECGRRLDWIDRDDNYCSNCGSDNSESTKELYKEWDTKLAEITEAKNEVGD